MSFPGSRSQPPTGSPAAAAGQGGAIGFLPPGRSCLLSEVTGGWLWVVWREQEGSAQRFTPSPRPQRPVTPLSQPVYAERSLLLSPLMYPFPLPSKGSSKTPGCSHHRKLQCNFLVGTNSNQHQMKPIREDTVILTGKEWRVSCLFSMDTEQPEGGRACLCGAYPSKRKTHVTV